jgi:hypothetical protein
MLNEDAVFKGIVHGRTIELEREPGMPDGQEVTVTVQPSHPIQEAPKRLPPGEGIRRSSGAWAEGGQELDQYIESVHERRRAVQRRPIEP